VEKLRFSRPLAVTLLFQDCAEAFGFRVRSALTLSMGGKPERPLSTSLHLASIAGKATSTILSALRKAMPTSQGQQGEQLSQDSRTISNAWSENAEAANDYLSARIPYPRYIIDYIIAYHEHSAADKKVRWDAVLDLGCGPGQLAMLLSTKFQHVYGRDVSDDMISIAKTLPLMEKESLERVGLPKPHPECTFDFA
jgi:uncharacterized protein (DUF736 family)